MNKKVIIGIGALLGLALLAGAAFMAARLFGAAQPDEAGVPGGNGSVSTKFKLTPAPEVPQTQPDLAGQVTDIKDNSIFVTVLPGNGNENNAVIIGKDAAIGGSDSGPSVDANGGQGAQSPTPSEPVTEVVVSKDTLIYRDTTKDNVPRNAPGSSVNIVQQIVVPIDVSQIAKDFRIQVWGQRRGDRVIAERIIVAGARVVQFNPGDGEAPPK